MNRLALDMEWWQWVAIILIIFLSGWGLGSCGSGDSDSTTSLAAERQEVKNRYNERVEVEESLGKLLDAAIYAAGSFSEFLDNLPAPTTYVHVKGQVVERKPVVTDGEPAVNLTEYVLKSDYDKLMAYAVELTEFVKEKFSLVKDYRMNVQGLIADANKVMLLGDRIVAKRERAVRFGFFAGLAATHDGRVKGVVGFGLTVDPGKLFRSQK